MTRTFLIEVEVPDDGTLTLQEIADDIYDAAESVVEVNSVKPWSGQTGLSLPPTPPSL